MQKLTVHKGPVVPIDRENVDTDAIIPKQFLKSIKRTGYGANLFDAWRYLDPGEIGQDPDSRRPNPDFILNQPRYQGASILLARENFGCGSSREQAVWALQNYGFRVLIAPSFADIFTSNCFKNGLLTVVLSGTAVSSLFEQVFERPGYELTIDLEAQTVACPDGTGHHFEIEPFRKHCLLGGLDEISLTLHRKAEIEAFEARRLADKPWLAYTLKQPQADR